MKPFPRATEVVHDWVRERVEPGSLVVDATAGNGHDTVFLAELVGAEGKVLTFDIQEQAMEETRRRLKTAGLLDRVSLIQAGHETMADHAEPESVQAVMFNLGYLPGSDKARITQTDTTLSALRAAERLLSLGGVITVVAYTGHEGGDGEAESVLAYGRELDPVRFRCIRWDTLNSEKAAPFAVGIQRRSGA